MKIAIDEVMGQLYITPYVKVTYDKTLNGNYEFIIGWLKWQLTIIF
jgi:hypothetical protein